MRRISALLRRLTLADSLLASVRGVTSGHPSSSVALGKQAAVQLNPRLARTKPTPVVLLAAKHSKPQRDSELHKDVVACSAAVRSPRCHPGPPPFSVFAIRSLRLVAASLRRNAAANPKIDMLI